MNCILCEGLNDLIFLHELLISQGVHKDKILQLKDKKISKLQKAISKKWYNENYSVIIFPGGGVNKLTSKKLPRILTDSLKKINNDFNLQYIRDDPDKNSKHDRKRVREVLENLHHSKKRSSKTIHYKENNDFILRRNDDQEIIELKINTIPVSLEVQIVKKASDNIDEIHEKQKQKLLSQDPHESIKKIVNNHYSGNKKDLIRDTVYWTGTEKWFSDLENSILP